MFNNKGRVEKTDTGCYFYEQDIIFLDYDFSGDCIVDFTLNYQSPGFGIFLIENEVTDIFNSDYSLLYRIGTYTYNVEEKIKNTQSNIGTGSFFNIEPNGKTYHISFHKTDNYIYATYTDDEGNIFGGHQLTGVNFNESLNKYKIGFYSNKGNTINNVGISSGIPKNWIVNIHNTNGGRISFSSNIVKIEECEFNAEIEQQNILLKAGTYYLQYDYTGDIKDYINIANKDIKKINDYTKTILNDDGSFILDKDSLINIKFTGTNGTISNIAIKDFKDTTYISTNTSSNTNKQDASYIEIDLIKIHEFHCKANITSVPFYELSQKAPYYILKVGDSEYILETTYIDLNTDYIYSYDSTTRKFIINNRTIETIPANINTIRLLYNVNAIIKELTYTDLNDKTVDIINMDTQKSYVNNIIKSPIIVYNIEPYDLSSSYREVLKDNTEHIDLFNKYEYLNLHKKLNIFNTNIKVYGIPNTATIDKTQADISKFATSYQLISSSKYTVDVDNNMILIDQVTRDSFKYIAISYNSADEYIYYFTNWEREIFELKQSINSYDLTYSISSTSGKIIIYGIKDTNKVWDNYLYRVPNISSIHSIDLYTRYYDTLSYDDYSINYTKNRIIFNQTVLDTYKTIIIEYLKKDSYAINNIEDIGQYEVDVSTNNKTSYILYDMNEDNSIVQYTDSKIKANNNKYIVLSKDGE